MADQPLATVAILTYNGETYLERILEAVEKQDVDGPVEILVIDSGSSDSTLDIVARHPGVILHQIPNSEFGHGKTRNLAARLGSGTYIAYLTHDAVPLDDQWLRQLLLPFALNTRVVASVGRQVARRRAFPMQKYEISSMFGGLGTEAGTTLFFDDATIPAKQYYIATFYSDVNSAALRSFLVDVIPYRDVLYAEDQMFAQDLITAGYIKAYSSRGAVEHSNDLTLSEYRRRIFDETVGLRRIGEKIDPLGPILSIRFAVSGIVADTYRVLRDRDYNASEKLKWLFANPFYHVAKWRSYWRATRVHLEDHEAIRSQSLEQSRKTP